MADNINAERKDNSIRNLSELYNIPEQIVRTIFTLGFDYGVLQGMTDIAEVVDTKFSELPALSDIVLPEEQKDGA